MIVGNPSAFAIESSITQAYERLGQRALGFFVIHIDGKSYGVRSPDATLLACSLDAVQRRISRRGTHCAPFAAEADARGLADAFLSARFSDEQTTGPFLGMSSTALDELLTSNEIIWAPDGDEAFDDGSYVLQFDCGNVVRLIAFRNTERREDVATTLVDVSIAADDFYRILDNWQAAFEAEWESALNVKTKH